MAIEISQSSLSPTMIILILVVALLLFGPSKLPELGRSFGKTLREFKKGAQEVMNDEEPETPKPLPQDQPPQRKEIGPDAHKNDSKRLPD